MFGWFSAAADCASRRKRSTKLGSVANSANSTLIRSEVRRPVPTPVVDADDVRMVQRRRGLRFAAEALDEARVGGELGEQHLDPIGSTSPRTDPSRRR